jgi:hypothetical protein
MIHKRIQEKNKYFCRSLIKLSETKKGLMGIWVIANTNLAPFIEQRTNPRNLSLKHPWNKNQSK